MFPHNIDTQGPNYEMNNHHRKILISNKLIIIIITNLSLSNGLLSRSMWLCGLSSKSAAARPLRRWVLIPYRLSYRCTPLVCTVCFLIPYRLSYGCTPLVCTMCFLIPYRLSYGCTPLVCTMCCAGSSICEGILTPSEESYRQSVSSVKCNLETSKRSGLGPTGAAALKKNKTKYTLRNTDARSRNHCRSGKTVISITYCECVFVNLGTQHAKRMRHIIICGLSDSSVFFHIIT